MRRERKTTFIPGANAEGAKRIAQQYVGKRSIQEYSKVKRTLNEQEVKK